MQSNKNNKSILRRCIEKLCDGFNISWRVVVMLIVGVALIILFCLDGRSRLSTSSLNGSYEKPAYSPNSSSSIFIYMCGSNLESKQGLASKNIDELLNADIPDNVTVVIETGGAKEWKSHNISNNKLQRYTIKDKKLFLEEELDSASMGSEETFTDFLKWGKEKYPADRNFLVLWDHGSSSAQGVCYDENYANDCLEQEELKNAFHSADLGKKYDMIIFDACYMGCIETASLVQDYFYYMIASQKVVPGSGMNYTEFISSLSSNDDEALGKIICDSFFEKCKKKGVDTEVQLSFYNLAGTDNLIEEINFAGRNLLIRQHTENGNHKIIYAAMNSVINDGSEKNNVVDLLTYMENAIRIDSKGHYDKIKKAKAELLPYQVKGENSECSGVSLYYPLHYDESQLQEYLEICPIDNYATLLKDIYSNVPTEPIGFENTGSVNSNGRFEITLTDSSCPYLFGAEIRLWKEQENHPNNYVLLGTDAIEIYGTNFLNDFSKLTLEDNFDGKWYHLEGHPLLTDVVLRRHTTSVYAPINVNGSDTLLNFLRFNTANKKILSVGMIGVEQDEYGFPSRDIKTLSKGDKVRVYAATNEGEDFNALQEEFTIENDITKIDRIELPEGKYRIQFIISDILGNTIGSDYAVLELINEGDNISVTVTDVISSK